MPENIQNVTSCEVFKMEPNKCLSKTGGGGAFYPEMRRNKVET